MHKWLIGAGVTLFAIVAVFSLATVGLKPWLRERMIAAIKEQYKSDVELNELNISLFPRFTAVAEGLTLRQKGRPGLPPLITVKRLTVKATLSAVLSDQSR